MAGGGRVKGLSSSCILLIVIAGMERFAFKGVASNLVSYLTDTVKMSNSSAAKTVNSWCGFTSMLPLLVAPLADLYWDRYSTILTSSFLYVLGLGAVASTAMIWRWSPPSNKSSPSFLFWSLCLISLGQGAYNPSLQAFGADQLDHDEELPSSKDDQTSNKKSMFFQWWYFGVCSGSLLGVILMSYIQDTFGWVLGFAIPMIAMLTSVAIFTCGSRIHAYKPDKTIDGKPLRNILQAIKVTASKLVNGRIRVSLPDEEPDTVELELQEKPLCDQKFGSNGGFDGNPRNDTYLLENAKVVLRLLPIWVMLLMFAVIFQQPATFFTKQGMTMKRNMGRNFKIPPATLQSAITLSIILMMPLYENVLIPITQIFTRNRKGITVLQRMGVGMFLSIIAMIIAAVVETKRLEISRKMSSLQSETVTLSIFWLLPQYVILGISDIFTVVGMQEFFYNEVPVRMQTMGFALYTSVFGLGSFLSALMISVIEAFTGSEGRQSWFSNDMREDGLDKYYWLLALTSALSLLFYAIFCTFYTTRSELENGNCK
ncbi:protein NRT1/ PTR FAMILY 5.9-like [Hibiscus syriacus]|uniref:protein NRT1/ PTR FAMILY 5.9-like n=1 Tax=Hibiscus syriacus TaxID=106335 RepID=UPI0019240199|nr:protein NRT1/ PTR FAMILY 5.9-like [Hibiscus syriacus]